MKAYLLSVNPQADVTVYPLHAPKGKTDMIRIKIPGTRGKSKGMDSPVEMAQVNAEEVSDELDGDCIGGYYKRKSNYQSSRYRSFNYCKRRVYFKM